MPMLEPLPIAPPSATAADITPRPPSAIRWLHALTWVAALSAVAWATASAWNQGETYDEPMHLEWSRRLYEEGETERVSHPLYNSKAPVTLLNVWARKRAKDHYQGRTRELLFAARLPTVAWLVVLLITTYFVSRAILGPVAADLATIMVALDPNLVAHGSLVTVDVPYAAATLLTIAAALRVAARPGAPAALALGIALGLAFAIKYSAVLLLLSLMFLPLAWRRRTPWTRLLLIAAIVAILAAVTIDAAYLFKGVGRPLSDRPWKSAAVAAVVERAPSLALPLPLDFLSGLDSVIGTERHRSWPVIVLGQLRPKGVWHYFAVQWVLKTPVLILAALLGGLWRGRRRLREDRRLQFILAALVVHVLYFSLIFRAQIGYRYVLMCLPLAAALAAAGLASTLTARGALLLASCLVVVTAVEAVPYLDNPLAFTNAAVQPKRDVYRLIADSSIDWGQNDAKLLAEIERRGIRGHVDPAHILPGLNVVALNTVAGVAHFERYRWVRKHLSPTGHIGHTHLVYDVTPEQYERFLEDDRRFDPRAGDEQLCAAARFDEPVSGARAIELAPPDGTRVPVVCVRAERTADFEWRISGGHGIINRTGERLREGEPVHGGQRLVMRLRPGVHAFILGRQSGLEGHWISNGVTIGHTSADLRAVLAPPPPGA